MQLTSAINDLLRRNRTGKSVYRSAVLNELQGKPMYQGFPALEDERRHKHKELVKRRARNKVARRTRASQRARRHAH